MIPWKHAIGHPHSHFASPQTHCLYLLRDMRHHDGTENDDRQAQQDTKRSMLF